MDNENTPSTSLEAEAASSLPTLPPRRNLRWLYWLPLAFVLGLVAGYLVFALPLSKELASANQELAALRSGSDQAAVEVPKNVKRYEIPTEGYPTYGPQDAAITIVEFSDYECPFCKQWHDQVWLKLEEKYGSQIRLVYRDFPLYGLHDNAAPAAEAAYCAEEQGKYWDFHSMLFSGEYRLERKSYEAIAVRIGLDGPKFAVCLDAGKYKDIIQGNYDFASKLGVSSTPTFFVNGMALVGAQPFEVFDRLIQMEIKGELPKN